METDNELKTGVSVSDMAKMLGLSRSRCYQLIDAGILYPPVFDVLTRRPFFPSEIQEKNLEVRKRNMGANGKAILFYAQRISAAAAGLVTKPTQKTKPKTQGPKPAVDRLIEDLKALGIDCPNSVHIEKALKECFPAGIKDIDENEVLRSVYRFLRRQNLSDNVER